MQREEKAMISIMEQLEVQEEAITSATRMGKLRPESIRPGTFLVRFREKNDCLQGSCECLQTEAIRWYRRRKIRSVHQQIVE